MTVVSYKQTALSNDYAILIGSGIGSLGAAALAKKGKKCLVLERHYAPEASTYL